MKKNIDLINGKIDSTLRRFALPLVASFVIQNVYTWVDMYYVSRISSTAIAAIKVSEQMIFMVLSIVGGVAIGSGIIIARRLGEGEKEKANHAANQSTVFMAIVSLMVAVFFYFITPVLTSLFHLHSDVSELILNYNRAVCFGIPATFLVFHLNSIVRATGNSIFPMFVLITSNILNAIIAPFFVFGIGPFPKLGMQGAGIATAIAQNLGLLIAIWGIYKNYVNLEFKLRNFKFDFDVIWNIFRLGVPATLQFIAVSVNRMLIISIANSFGVVVLTTYMFGVGVDLFVFMSIFAIGASIEIITGQNIGANRLDRVMLFHKSAVKQLSLLLLILAVVVYFFGENFARIFTSEPQLIMEIKHYLRIATFAYIPFSVGIVTIRVISGAGDYFRSFVLVAIVFFGVQLPLAYILSHFTGLKHYGIWYAILISQISFAVISYISLRNGKWLKAKV